ncbi:MAG: hypothetical protein PVJ98_00270 [Akkermansiaceae bacterium]
MDDPVKPMIFCAGFGSFALIAAFFKITYEVIQEDEVRLRLSAGPLSFIAHRTPMHSEFPFEVGFNETNEVVIFANHGTPNQMFIGPFQSEEKANDVLARFRYLELSEDRHREERSARAQQEIKDLTSGVSPGLLRFLQMTLAGLFILPGLIGSDPNRTILSTACLLASLVVSEIWIISKTNIVETSPDFQSVKFTRRFRYLWVDTYAMNPLEPESIVHLDRSFNRKIYIPVLLFLIGGSILLTRNTSSEEPPLPPPIKNTPRSPQEEENLRRGIDLLEKAQKAREAKDKTSAPKQNAQDYPQ